MSIDKLPDDDASITSGKHISYWTDSVDPSDINPLKENIDTR